MLQGRLNAKIKPTDGIDAGLMDVAISVGPIVDRMVAVTNEEAIVVLMDAVISGDLTAVLMAAVMPIGMVGETNVVLTDAQIDVVTPIVMVAVINDG